MLKMCLQRFDVVQQIISCICLEEVGRGKRTKGKENKKKRKKKKKKRRGVSNIHFFAFEILLNGTYFVMFFLCLVMI
jgi:hypothetical protein